MGGTLILLTTGSGTQSMITRGNSGSVSSWRQPR